MTKRQRNFDVRRNGSEIENVHVRGSVSPNITYSIQFAEWEACNGAGLNLWEWESNIYPLPFKVKVMAWWKNHNLVNLHTQDEVNKKSKNKNKR